MKKLLLAVVTMLTFAACSNLDTSVPQLSDISNRIKTENEEMFQLIEKFAEKDWKGNHEMMIHTINNQALAIEELGKFMDRYDYDSNLMNEVQKKFVDMETFVCDYEKILHEYKKQLKSKGAY